MTSGGRALGFYSSLRVEVKRGELIEEDKKVIGQQVKFRVTKSKVSPPFREGYLGRKIIEDCLFLPGGGS